jgi:hypothetical protein
MRILLGALGMIGLLIGTIGFLLSKTSINEVAAGTLLAAGAAALAGAAVVEAVAKLTKVLSDRTTPDFAADKVVKEVAALRAEVKALRTDLDERVNEVRSS